MSQICELCHGLAEQPRVFEVFDAEAWEYVDLCCACFMASAQAAWQNEFLMYGKGKSPEAYSDVL